MNKEPENTNKELLKLKQELNELNCRISTQQKHIQKLCSEVEEREKELRFYHKAEKILNNTSLSPEKNFQKVVDLLPAAFQFPERTAISLKINEWIFNSKEFIDSNIFIEANIQIENSLIGFIKACYNYDGQKKISNKFLKEEKNLLKILSKRLSEYYVKYLNDLELKKNEDTYQNLVDNINDIIYEITADGTLTYINNAAFLISGYHPNELIGKSFFEKIYPNDLPIVYKALSELGNEKHINIEFRYLGKDGNIKWVRSSTKPILENGIAIGGRGVLIDIHETKTAQILLAQNEKKLQFKTRLQELLVDISNKYINLPLDQIDFKINKSLGDLGKFIGADRFYIFDYDFDQQTCSNTYEWCAEGIEAQIDELQNVPFEYFPEWLNAHCKGETLYVEDVLALDPEDNLRIILEPQGIKSLVAVPIMDADKCIGFTGFDAVIDYHTYSSEEVELLKVFAQMLVNIKNRLKNQHELEKSNQKINVLLNNLSGVIYHSDFDGRNWNLSFMNDAVFELTGYKAADFINNTKIEFNDLIDKEDLPRVLEEVQKATKNKLPYNIEYRIYTAEGQQKWVWEKGHGVFEGKKLIGLEGFISDITEKKQIEEELLKSEEELNQAQEIAKMGSWFMNLLTGEITLSHNYYKLVERAEKDTKSKEDLLLPLIHKDDIHLIENKLVEIAAAKSQGTQELRLIMPDGRIKWVQSTILPVYHNDVLVAYKGVKIDITEKKLQESEIHKLINVVEQSPISIIVTNIDGSIEYANPKACEISGYTKEELETKNPRIFKSGETQQQEYSKLWKTISSGKEWKGIFHNKKKDGSLYWESANIAPIFDSYGNITQYLALKEDITHKKELDEELALKEFRYRELTEHSRTVIWEVDANGLYTYVSPMAEYLYGFSADELIHKKHFYDIAPEEAREDVKTFGFETLRQGVLMVNFENQVERKDGKIIWVNTNARPFFDEENNIIGYRGSDNDITEKKLQEEEISLKNAKLNAILDAMPDMIFTSDSDGNYLEFFKLFKNKKINDYSYLIGKNIEDEFPADVAALHIEKIKACLQTKKLISYEYPKVEDGKTRYFDGRIVFMDQDKVLCFVRDITNRKEQENEIKKLTIAIEQSPIAIVITNLDATIEYVSPAFQKITGYSKEEVIGKKPSILKSGQTSDTVYKNLWTTISAGNIWNGEFLNKKKNGDLYWESTSITPIQDENKLTTGYLALKEDITEQKNAAKQIIELNANLEVKIDERTAELQQANNILEQEIEQRKQIEEALSKSEYNYRSVIENVNEVIFKTDENGLWLFLNKSWEEITGFTVEESLGQLFVNYVHPDDRQRNMELFLPLINREKDYCRHQVRYLTKAGGFRWIEVFARLAVNEFDEITGTYGTLNDITERKKAEDELKIEKQRLASIIEGTNVGTWEWNIKTGEIIFNERWANILGYSLEEISPINIETWLKFAHPEDLDKSNELLQMHFQGKLAYYTLESRMKHRNGSWIWVLANGKVNAWDTDGKPLVMSGTHLDITERKKAEEELNWNKTLLELMSNSSPFGFLVVDNRTDDILYFNKRFCQIWEIEHLQEQIERGELKNNDIIPFCIPILSDVPAFAESCKPLQSEENRMVLDDEISFTNNRTIRRFTTQIRGNNDEYFGRFYIFENITEDKRKSEELINARNEAIIANKAKSTFLANMSHEIRTPMNAILGYSDILNTVITEKTHKEFINSIQTSGKSLLSIINDVLDLAKIEADKIELEFDYIKTASFFSEFKDIFGPKLKKNRVDFVVEIAEDIPDGLYVDEARLRQVLINLIGNSVKFTPKGFIKVSVTFENPQTVAYSKDKSEAFIDLIIKVEDTGIGISEELHDKIFEEFVQAEGKNIQGTGLGLTISKRLVNLMNGTLSVTSKINKGSVFKITIPEVAYLNSFNKKLPDNFINPENILFEKATILVVDDIEINRRYIKDVFKNSKIKIIEASSGKIGLKKAEEIIPDLIISDIRMPEMDGFEFLDLMKQNINLRQIPVIAYSASVMKEQKKRIYESGFASLLTKPVLLDELINEICKYLPYQLKQPELHDYIESKENITDLEGLIQTFENQFTSNWTALKKRQPIGEIKEFSKNIIAAGKLHNANFIIRYGEEMLNAAENFNIDKVLTLLKEYPKLIKNLNNLWKP